MEHNDVKIWQKMLQFLPIVLFGEMVDPKMFDSALHYIYYALGNIKLICPGLRFIVNMKKNKRI